MTILLGLAVACGVLSALAGNRTAWALLVSLGLCLFLGWQEVPFSFPLWLLIDLAVVLIIIRPAMGVADVVILALFIPAWVGYLLPEPERYQIGFAVVVFQLLLTFPAETVRRKLSSLSSRNENDRFDRMVAYA